MRKFTSIKQLHRVSGIVLAGFILLHTINHLFAIGGPALHFQLMQLFRKLYRFPPIEVLLLLSVAFQIVSGLTLIFKVKGVKTVYDHFQIWSGLYLSFFMIYHIRAVMLGRYVWQVETDFHFAASVVKTSPSRLFFIPYYALSIIAAFTHIGCVHYKKMTHKNSIQPISSEKKIKRQVFIIIALGIGCAAFIVKALVDSK